VALAPGLNNLAAIQKEQRKYEEAEAAYRRALGLWEKALGPDHHLVATGRSNLSAVLGLQGKYEEAQVEARAALALRLKVLGPQHPDIGESHTNLGAALKAQGKYEEAQVEFRAALAVLDKALGPDHPQVAQARNNLADVLIDLHRPAEALPLAERAWARHRRDDVPATLRGETAFLLASLLWTLPPPARDRPRARELGEEAQRSFQQVEDPPQEAITAIERWLDDHPRPGRADGPPSDD
jgi:tetratricopeptide (TPR) repeat protein